MDISGHQFDQEVLQSNKLVLVDFWASWCQPCLQLSPIISKVVQSFQNEVKLVKVNVDDEEELARLYSIRSIPTLLFFKNGKVVDNTVGLVNESMLTNLVSKALLK